MKLKLHLMAGLLLSLAGSCALVQSVQAQFTDQSRDLILTFRQVGGIYVFEVDLGQASIYYGAAPGSSIPITAYDNNAQLGTLFSSFNSLSWSVVGCVPTVGDSGDPSIPNDTLWLTDPRSDPNTPAAPWTRQSVYTQGGADSYIVAILYNALSFATSATPDSVTNTPTAAAIATSGADSGDSASGSLGGLGNFLGTFQGDVENTTPSDFIYNTSPSRSDLYELQPTSSGTSPAGTYLGYFELGIDGSMTFHAPTLTYPAPSLSVSTDGAGNVYVSFPSTANGTYTLYYTNAAGLAAPVSTWSAVSTNIIGDGTVKSFQQSISGTGAFYSVGVH
jgi:hypothetical protein